MGWAWLAGGRARNKASQLPLPGARAAGGASRLPASPQPGDALAPGTLAGARGRGEPPPRPLTAPLRDNGPPPLPRLREGRYKGREARPGTEPGVRKVKAEEGEGTGEDGGGRGSPRAAPPAVQASALSLTAAARAGERTSSLSSPGREGRGVCTQRGAGPPPSANTSAGDGPTRSGRRRPAAPAQPEPLRGRDSRWAPLSRTHPKLRAPAHSGT